MKCAVRACVPSRAPVVANMIMTAVRANPAPGILAQIFINLSRSDVRRDGDLIRLRIIFFCGKSHALLLLVDRRSHFCAEFMTADVCSECKFYLIENYFRYLFRYNTWEYVPTFRGFICLFLMWDLKRVRKVVYVCGALCGRRRRRQDDCRCPRAASARVATSPRSLPRTHLARLHRLPPIGTTLNKPLHFPVMLMYYSTVFLCSSFKIMC